MKDDKTQNFSEVENKEEPNKHMSLEDRMNAQSNLFEFISPEDKNKEK